MEATTEPIFTGPAGPAGLAVTAADSGNLVDTPASSEVDEGVEVGQIEGEHRISVWCVFRIVSILLESFALRCTYLFVLNYSVLPGQFSSYR